MMSGQGGFGITKDPEEASDGRWFLLWGITRDHLTHVAFCVESLAISFL